MAVIVAEYLGVRTDTGIKITPIPIGKNIGPSGKPIVACPFKNSHCDKAKRGDKPVCSLRDSETNELWIVCSHRLCATQKGSGKSPMPLSAHQKNILLAVAKEVFDPSITNNEVLVNREVPIPVTQDSDYSADYVMWRKNPTLITSFNPDRPIVLEMQGGGETTSTGDLTKHITEWENGRAELTSPVSKTAPLVTNAWRRQQEQFLVKGNTAMLTGGRMVFCIGSMIYDYLIPRLTNTTIFPPLKNANWTLALLTFIEDKSAELSSHSPPNSIPLKIDTSRSLFTNYGFFVQAITNQGTACNAMFQGPYVDLV
ncbi:restriction endonuclease [Undibacterium jejuense]|uniref:Restriction endonuclease n=1 Tax=Undibacterium jejuense TaxID=1344949 RepID=A0A923HL31_9BURK|nr:restriction endonuclease [Undibacterium jejuense]MBC3864245.1 restriction endonuclease [Undibacterium jejuense]